MSALKIISLLENTSDLDSVKAEHGLSLYIETDRRKILFDMGQSALFSDNAEALGIRLDKVDLAVLSHGHYDHGGGLKKFMEVNGHAPIYISRHAFLPHYNGTEKYIGLDVSLERSERIVFTDNVYHIDEGLSLFSCNDLARSYPLESFGLTERMGSRFVPDDFRHEQYLLITEKDKRVLISGCSHKGILDIVEWFKPDVLIGGFHFSKMPLDDRLLNIAETLDTYPTEYHTCHCTGRAQFDFMKRKMKNLNYLSCGQVITID